MRENCGRAREPPSKTKQNQLQFLALPFESTGQPRPILPSAESKGHLEKITWMPEFEGPTVAESQLSSSEEGSERGRERGREGGVTSPPWWHLHCTPLYCITLSSRTAGYSVWRKMSTNIAIKPLRPPQHVTLSLGGVEMEEEGSQEDWDCCGEQQQGQSGHSDCPAGGVTQVGGAGADLRSSVLQALVTPIQPAAS